MSRERDSYDMFQPPDRGRFGDNDHAPAARDPRVTGASDLKDLELFQHAKTAAAVLVSNGRHGTKPQWIPLSQCQVEPIAGRTGRVWNDDRRKWAPVVVVTLPEWLAREKGLV